MDKNSRIVESHVNMKINYKKRINEITGDKLFAFRDYFQDYFEKIIW